MSTTSFEHGTPWTDEEYLTLNETSDRVELFDGSLHVTPAPSVAHQRIAMRLAQILVPAVEQAGLEVLETVNVRLKRGRIPIPDLVVCTPVDADDPVVEVATVALVVEITSPGNAATDRVLKMHYYAEAGIPWYLLVDPQPLMLRLFRLEGDRYSLYAEAGPEAVLSLVEPVRVDIDAARLTRRRATP